MQKVVIYPGRFQPMLAHHAEVYKQLQAEYPDADVYIGTSDKVEGDKSPFNFEEKQKIASAHGIPEDKVLQATRPYHKDDYDKFDEKSTIIIFAVGEKDLDRFPFNNVDPETGLDMTVRGETRPKYYQPYSTLDSKNPITMDKRGYITLAPTIKTGDEVASASAFRERFKNSPDEESAKEYFVDQFGEYNDEVFNLIYNKIVRNKMSEELNILKKLAGLNEGPAVDFDDYQTISKKDAKAASERPEKAAASDPESVGFQKPDPEKFHSTIKKSIANRMDSEDVNDPQAKKDAFMKELLKSPETLLGEINARLAVDDNGLAVSDRLSDIINKLGDGGLSGLEGDDKTFTIKLVANALKNMELVKDPKADQEKAEYEKELEDSVNLDDIRSDYGINEIAVSQAWKGFQPQLGYDANRSLWTQETNFERSRGGPNEKPVDPKLEFPNSEFDKAMLAAGVSMQDLKKARDLDAKNKEDDHQAFLKRAGLSKPTEPAESFDPRAEQSREDQAYDELMDVYEKDGEEALAKALGMSVIELDNEISEFGIEHRLHADDDRDEIIQRYIEDVVDNADWKDYGEQDFDPADAEMESIQEGGDCHHCKGDDPDCKHCDGSGYVQFDDDPQEPSQEEIDAHYSNDEKEIAKAFEQNLKRIKSLAGI